MMRKMGVCFLFSAVAVAWSTGVYAQETAEAFVPDQAHDSALRVSVGMDPALAFGAGYVRAIDLGSGPSPRRLGIHFDLATILGFSSWDLRGGASMRIRQVEGFDVLTNLDLGLKVAQNDVHTALVYGYGAALRPGWYGASFYAALDLSLRGTIAATLFHKDEYRKLFPAALDGTIATDHLAFFAGLAGGVQIKQRVLIGARFAWRFPRTFETYSPYFLPYTMNMDAGVRF